jgi:hypothetical protein
LPGAAPATAAPSHDVVDTRDATGVAPSTLVAGDHRGRVAVRFAVIDPPRRAGDGWAVADAPGQPAVAVLLLPGEAPIYGGQDLRSASETWQLAVGPLHRVEVAAARIRGIRAELPVFAAVGAPQRVVSDARSP